MAPSLPGQSGSWCGQAIQVASCRSHSAGKRQVAAAASGAKVSAQNGRVGVDAPIAEKGPVAARVLDQPRIAPRREDGRLGSRFGDDAAERVGDERVSEELD